MTYPTAGTINAVQAALSISAASCSAYVSSGPPYSITNYPVALEHGLNETYWADPGLIQQMNAILTQANYAYRI